MTDLNSVGKSIVAVIHDLAQAARYASQLIVMKGGRIHAVGKPDDVKNETMVHDVYGFKTKLFAGPISGTALISPVKKSMRAASSVP